MATIFSELSFWFYALALFILVDATKVFVEIWNRPRKRKFASSISDVTALIPTHNGAEVIQETIQSLLKLGLPRERILVVDDGSTDDTPRLLRALDVPHYTVPHRGKVSAINFGIHRVRTDFVLLLDDDTRIGAARIPTGLLSDHDAVAFNVVPDRRDRHGPAGSNLISCIQRYEYCKSMEIGKRFQDATASIACVSGAIGLFKRERLQAHHHRHRGAFEGEDLERTLLEHLFHGQVVFADEMVWTVVPDRSRGLLRQRLFNWYPAQYHMFLTFWKLLLRRNTRLRLRYEMAYNIFVVLFEPLRVYSLLVLLFGLRASELGLVYLLYLALETYPFVVIQRTLNTGRPLLVLLLYPIYNLGNMLVRQAALGVWLWKRFVTKEMKPKTEEDRKWWLAPNQ